MIRDITVLKKLQKVMKDAGGGSVSTHEMTDTPNWIAKTFSTTDAEIKGAGRDNTDNERMMNEIGQSLRSKGGPGKVVIIAKLKS